MWLCGRLSGCWSRRDRLEGEGEGGVSACSFCFVFLFFFFFCGRRSLRWGEGGLEKSGGDVEGTEKEGGLTEQHFSLR